MLVVKEESFKQEFVQKQVKVVNFDVLQQQFDEMQDMLCQLLCQLLGKIEMFELLVDILQMVLLVGFEVDLFQLGVEILKDFYVEELILLWMIGMYYQFGIFISGVVLLLCVVIFMLYDVLLIFKQGFEGSGQLVL